MELKDNIQVFNLWDTNGRRADVLNAIEIYLSILTELEEEIPDFQWKSYPSSMAQFLFYQKAIEASPEVFRSHGKYDKFICEVSQSSMERRDISLNAEQKKTLDVSIESRARHYTSNLVRLGFAQVDRAITSVGKAYYKNYILRDKIEEILPIATTNLIILRQLLKFKTYTKPDAEGKRISYSPLFMALYVLLSGVRFNKDDFKTIVQSLTPYNPMDPDVVIEQCKNKDYSFAERDYTIPRDFFFKGTVEEEIFVEHVKNSKQKNTSLYYYEFYKKLYNYYYNRSDENYELLKETYIKDPSKLKQAFGNGHKVFEFGRQNAFSHEEFIESNASNPFLVSENFNTTFYDEYVRSKLVDQAKENADTTVRLFSASGLISLGKALPELVDSDIYELLFDKSFLKENIFVTVTEEEYCKQKFDYETNISLSEILGFSAEQTEEILSSIATKLGKDNEGIKQALTDRTRKAFLSYVKQEFPKERVSALLRGFSANDGGAKIRDIINPSCSIPTAYEYVTALAWYYISDKDYDLYGSMNLTMGADFEPERFAPGGAGDIVVEYDDMVVMLEVTMMNSQAQKRGEWEPVLRHSVNLMVESAPKDTITFFVANELDYNTINIWRAVAMVPLKSSNSEDIVSGVAIMPLTSDELASMIEMEVRSSDLISKVQESFSDNHHGFDENWRNQIVSEVQ